MPIKKELRYGVNNGQLTLWSSGSMFRGGITVYSELADAIRCAHDRSECLHQNSYVVEVEGKGFVVIGYADFKDYFGDRMREETWCMVGPDGSCLQEDDGLFGSSMFDFLCQGE